MPLVNTFFSLSKLIKISLSLLNGHTHLLIIIQSSVHSTAGLLDWMQCLKTYLEETQIQKLKIFFCCLNLHKSITTQLFSSKPIIYKCFFKSALYSCLVYRDMFLLQVTFKIFLIVIAISTTATNSSRFGFKLTNFSNSLSVKNNYLFFKHCKDFFHRSFSFHFFLKF